MRIAIITISFVLLNAAAVGADRETLTLTDGRTLVGYYDEDRQTMTLDGGKVTLRVPPETVQSRAPATTPPPHVVGKVKSIEGAQPTTAESAKEPLRASWTKVHDELARMRAQERAAEDRLVAEWAAGADLHSIPLPASAADPRKSEIEAIAKIHRVNAWVAGLIAHRSQREWQQFAQTLDQDLEPGWQAEFENYEALRR